MVAERAQRAANRKSTCELRKQLHQFYNPRAANAHNTTNKETHCKYSQHNQTKKRAPNKILYLVVLWAFAVHFFIWLCSQHNQINNFIWSTFLCLFVLWVFVARVLSNWWSCFLNLQVFIFLFAARFFVWLCCEHLQCISLFGCVVSICSTCCQIDEDVFLICWCFFYLHVFSEVAARWALSATVKIWQKEGKERQTNRKIERK